MQNRIYYIASTAAILMALALFGRCAKQDSHVDAIEIAPIGNDTLFSGKEYRLEVALTPASVSDPRLSWSVSDAQLASIQYGGVLKPLKGGDITVYVNSLQSGGKKVRASRKFVILNSGVYFKDRSVTVNPLEVKKMEYRYLPEDFKPPGKPEWVSRDSEIATVDSEGNVKGLQLGQTVIKVRLGNPLSGFFSEDSCLVTVENFKEPLFTYAGGVLEMTQDVPGLLPMIARDMPHFTKIILKGPINGSDLMFFIENSEKIDHLDLGGTHVVKGGRVLKATLPPWYKEETFATEKNFVGEGFFLKMPIKKLVLPRFITSPFNFGKDFQYESLTFPDSYESIEIFECNVETIRLPDNLKSFVCNIDFLKESDRFSRPTAIFHKRVVLPASLKKFKAIADFKEDLLIPGQVDEILLAEQFKTLEFAPNKAVKIELGIIAKWKKARKPIDISIEKLILPEGLETIASQAFATYLPGEPNLKKLGHTLKTVIFPSTLRKIGPLAFSKTYIEAPVLLPEGLKEISHSAFLGSYLKEVHIPASVESVGDQAFALCPRLEEVYMRLPAPPRQTGANVFLRERKMGKIHRLHVPKGATQAYKEAGYLDYFFEIVETE